MTHHRSIAHRLREGSPRAARRCAAASVGLALAIALAGACVPGCAKVSSSGNPYAPLAEGARNPLRAQELTLRAADLIAGDPAEAESLLREALGADLYHGPAHNNLGVLYLKQGKLYEAAGEFEWAKKLLPGHPDPRMNLALTLEKAGRTDDAIEAYRTALEVYPDHLPTIQALTRLQVQTNNADATTTDHLRTIALRGEPQWRKWADKRLANRK